MNTKVHYESATCVRVAVALVYAAESPMQFSSFPLEILSEKEFVNLPALSSLNVTVMAWPPMY